jgi:MinD superfamily P-loop ATPase
MPTPIIRQLKRWKQGAPDQIVILDAPPGASCSVVETVRGSDFVLLVTEPTPFGLHDLKQMVGILREMGIPAGVVINRDGIGDGALEAYCIAAEGLPVRMLRIPFDRAIAEGTAKGQSLIDISPEYENSRFSANHSTIQIEIGHDSLSDEQKQLVVLSGKGGTGKTSITAALAHLAARR